MEAALCSLAISQANKNESWGCSAGLGKHLISNCYERLVNEGLKVKEQMSYAWDTGHLAAIAYKGSVSHCPHLPHGLM